jgi:predicted SprT family Zn-dependent metalloprotease
MYNYKDINIINEKAIFYAKELWNENYDIPVKQNNRLYRYYGWFKYFDDKEFDVIELAGYLLKNKYNELTVDSVLIHELCHWHSRKNNLNSDDYSLEFRELVEKCGGSQTRTIKRVHDKHYGICSKCNKEYFLQGYKEDKTYTGCCGTKIIYNRMEEIKDIYIPSEKLIAINNKFKEYFKSKYNKSA